MPLFSLPEFLHAGKGKRKRNGITNIEMQGIACILTVILINSNTFSTYFIVWSLHHTAISNITVGQGYY